MKKLIIAFVCCLAVVAASAQIGYQVSLLNNATGEPRANERVTVTVKITDSKGKVLCEETKNETTNDFGVISLSVGNGDTFANADWSSLPFYIEATVDNRLIGKSQLLSVPVAEHAKHTGILTKEYLCSKTWRYQYNWGGQSGIDQRSYSFFENGACILKDSEGDNQSFLYFIEGNNIYIFYDYQYDRGIRLTYLEEKDWIIDNNGEECHYYK